jgi:hypothetical protein
VFVGTLGGVIGDYIRMGAEVGLEPHTLYAQYLDLDDEDEDEHEDAGASGGASTEAEAYERKARLLEETGILGAEILRSTPADEVAAALASPRDTFDDMSDQSDTFRAASELQHYMINRVTDDGEVDSRAFKQARKAILSDPLGKKHAPECVSICREPHAVWNYVKGHKIDMPSYQSRRQFFQEEFEPLLSALERFGGSPLDDLVAVEAGELDSASVAATWEKAIDRRGDDPEGAITAARTLLESTCKTILDDRDEPYSNKDDLPVLYKKVQKVLKIAPSDHTEEQFKAILGACTTVVRELGSLRNRISDSHGPGRKRYRAAERHAALAVNLAGSMALFLMQTHEARA